MLIYLNFCNDVWFNVLYILSCVRRECVKCTVLFRVEIWTAYVESKGSRIPELSEMDSDVLPGCGFLTRARHRSIPAVLNSDQTQHAGAVITSGSFLHPDHQGLCSWSISDPRSSSGICVRYERLGSMITPQRRLVSCVFLILKSLNLRIPHYHSFPRSHSVVFQY